MMLNYAGALGQTLLQAVCHKPLMKFNHFELIRSSEGTLCYGLSSHTSPMQFIVVELVGGSEAHFVTGYVSYTSHTRAMMGEVNL